MQNRLDESVRTKTAMEEGLPVTTGSQDPAAIHQRVEGYRWATELEELGADISIEIFGVGKDVFQTLNEAFTGDDDEVIYSHAFGGIDSAVLLTKLGATTIGKLIDNAAKLRLASSKTVVKINQASLTLNGFTAESVIQLFESPGFHKAIEEIRKK